MMMAMMITMTVKMQMTYVSTENQYLFVTSKIFYMVSVIGNARDMGRTVSRSSDVAADAAAAVTVFGHHVQAQATGWHQAGGVPTAAAAAAGAGASHGAACHDGGDEITTGCCSCGDGWRHGGEHGAGG